MFEELKNYENNGHFFFSNGDSLRDVSKDVPNLPGIYYILRLAKGRIDLVYIGKSGTINSDGTFKNQGLKNRLNNIQKEMKRQEFFENKIKEEKMDALDIYWFVTFDNKNQDLPGFVEGLLFQKFFDIYQRLPEWNEEF